MYVWPKQKVPKKMKKKGNKPPPKKVGNQNSKACSVGVAWFHWNKPRIGTSQFIGS